MQMFDQHLGSVLQTGTNGVIDFLHPHCVQLFQDNRHVGEFVKRLEARIRANAGGKFSDFVVMKENGGEAFFIDMAVYTRNR